MRTERRLFLSGLGLVTLGTLAGCNSDSPDSPTETESPTETSTPDESARSPKLAPDDGSMSDAFGHSVGLAGDGATALIGAHRDSDPNGDSAGSAYVFSRSDGSWIQQAKLVPDDGDSGDYFGDVVELSADGSTAIVGAFSDEDPNGSGAGSAYVFTRTGDSWTQQAKLVPDDGDFGANFGFSVGLSRDGSTALVGASGDGPGSAYVFTRADGSWTQQSKLVPDDGDEDDNFGTAVDLSSDGTAALVGAHTDEDPNGSDSGSAYVFTRTSDSWTQQAKLVPDDGDGGDTFGNAVGVSGDGTTALIAAPGNDEPNGQDAGSVYVFSRASGSWSQRAKLAPEDGDNRDHFGSTVGLSRDGTAAIVGAPNDEDPNGEAGTQGGAGSAYKFARVDSSWGHQSKLVPDDGDEDDNFGNAVDLSSDGTTALVGASGDEDPNEIYAGSAYVLDV